MPIRALFDELQVKNHRYDRSLDAKGQICTCSSSASSFSGILSSYWLALTHKLIYLLEDSYMANRAARDLVHRAVL